MVGLKKSCRRRGKSMKKTEMSKLLTEELNVYFNEINLLKLVTVIVLTCFKYSKLEPIILLFFKLVHY